MLHGDMQGRAEAETCRLRMEDYRFFDLREERWEDGCDLIRPHDAVLFMDIHT